MKDLETEAREEVLTAQENNTRQYAVTVDKNAQFPSHPKKEDQCTVENAGQSTRNSKATDSITLKKR